MARYAALEGDVSAWTVTRAALFNGREETPAAGDALVQLLATMAVGEWKLLNDTTKNLYSGPVAEDGYDIYTRPYYDAQYIATGGVSADFTSDTTLKNYVMDGEGAGGGSSTTDAGRFFYSGVSFDHTRKIIVNWGGGHSNGAMNHGVYFNALTAAVSQNGRWRNYTDAAPVGPPDADNDGLDAREYDANWPAIDQGVWTITNFRWPQTITSPVIGPDNNVAPYSLHTYAALCYDETNDKHWVGGFSIGKTGVGGVTAAACVWDVAHATRAVTAHTGHGSLAVSVPAMVMPPDLTSEYVFYPTKTDGWEWFVYDINLNTSTKVSTGGSTNSAVGAAMWVENLTTSAKYDIVRWVASGNGRQFVVYPNLWPIPGGVQTNVSYPVGNGGGDVDGTYYTFEAGVTRKWGELSAFSYVPEDALIYTITSNSGAILIQTIDPFVGGATSAQRWHVDNWLGGSYTNAPTVAGLGTDSEFVNGFQNKLIDLGPTYKAWLLPCNPHRGDVYLIKRAAL